MDWRHADTVFAAGKCTYAELKNICVWVKHNAGMGSLYRSQHEFIFVYKQGSAAHRNNVQLGEHGRHRSNVWHYAGANSVSRGGENPLELHPTVKPTALVTDAILDSTRPGDIVLDPFLGSGTTLIAAERCGRRCFGMEIDPLYADTIIHRWEALTAREACQIFAGGQRRRT
jgi:DNA modification methylase